MKDEVLALGELNKFFAPEHGMEISRSLQTAEEKTAEKLLNGVLFALEKLLFAQMEPALTSVQIRPFLRIISKRIQVESKKADAWRYYLYGRYDGQQEKLFGLLIEKEEKIHTEEILARKNVGRIIRYLYTNGYSQQTQIAKDLQIEPGNLIKVMDLLVKEGLVDKTKGAKFVFYELSQRGNIICNRHYREASYMQAEADELSPFREKTGGQDVYGELHFELKRKGVRKIGLNERIIESLGDYAVDRYDDYGEIAPKERLDMGERKVADLREWEERQKNMLVKW